MLIAPRSCRAFSAAMAWPRMRPLEISTSLGEWWFCRWTVIVIGNSSPTVLAVYGTVGVVDEGSTLGSERISRRSG